ncbi:hypothetical protein GCM10010399_25600 [Dactylosporangium fulvum]|uniref:nitric oxide dioxygenase n=1 Tax=Dactylosporangium fulvum TaxID=53359 RepID=A0ABY5WA97_9ACTN|nr:globin domain-containing protein [Dactylosporangium fulvum]UWP86958.1 globin domain-containing protein [Dactylosporangium fulvum]
MLSAKARPVVQATLPAVADNIGTIAERFYRHMFTEHPDLLDGTFNRGNQASGAQQQALAGAVAAFADALVHTPDNLPERLLSRVAHKHASLGIRPDQYRIVHDHLMWADRLVKTSLPGQYITVRMPMPDGVRQPRQYSLTRADDGQHRQFSVKWVHGGGRPDGEVSTLLHQRVGVGDVLTMSLPYGEVVLNDSGCPVVFASAGIGIAPMAGMLSHLVAAGSHLEVMVLHADIDETSFALRRQVLGDVAALPRGSMYAWYERGAQTRLPLDGAFAGLMDLAQVPLPDGAAYYLCGPLPFMRAVRSSLIERGVPARDIQYEVFGPDLWRADLE